jgi:hypothetical protein
MLKVESSNNNLTKINKDKKCQKCNRNCKTRAVLCQKGHWIHYACDKLSEIEIELIDKKKGPMVISRVFRLHFEQEFVGSFSIFVQAIHVARFSSIKRDSAIVVSCSCLLTD